ncbi:hypothetical protein LQZ18_17330 [Lachnospiraceae bacterium ZAX-1]
MRKIIIAILSLCMIISVFTGCGRPKLTPDESVKAIYDLYIKGNTVGISKLGLSDKDIALAVSNSDDTVKSTISNTFIANGLDVEDSVIDEICTARKSALSKMESEFEVVSLEKKTAKVKIKTTYFDEKALYDTTFHDAVDTAEVDGYDGYDEYIDAIANAYPQNLIAAYNAVVPSEDKKDFSISCTIVNNTWVPADMSGFGNTLFNTISGQ